MATALRQFVRDEGGRLRVSLTDTDTGQPVQDLTGYTAVTLSDKGALVPVNFKGSQQLSSIDPTARAPRKSTEVPRSKVPEMKTGGSGGFAESFASGIASGMDESDNNSDNTGGLPGVPDSPSNTQLSSNSGNLGSNTAQNTPKTTSNAVERKPLGSPAFESLSQASKPSLSSNPIATDETQITKANISYGIYGGGKHRDQAPDYGTVDRVRTAVGAVLPGYQVFVTSGGGEYGSDRHRAENNYRAIDFNVVDPDGKTITPSSNPLEYNQIAESMASHGIKGIGHYGWGLHADTVRSNVWGASLTSKTTPPEFLKAVERGRANPVEGYQPVGVATPTSRDAMPTSSNNPLAEAEQLGIMPDFNSMTAGEIAFSGYGVQRTPEEQAKIAFTLAGELGPKTLQGLRNGDPEARQEMANAIATIDSRIRSVGLDATLTGNNYNSLFDDNMETTKANYREYQDVLLSTTNDTYAGKNFPTTPDATHYANMSIVSPSWANAMDSVDKVGDHTFGRISTEYVTPDSVKQDYVRQATETFQQRQGTSRPTDTSVAAAPLSDIAPEVSTTPPSTPPVATPKPPVPSYSELMQPSEPPKPLGTLPQAKEEEDSLIKPPAPAGFAAVASTGSGTGYLNGTASQGFVPRFTGNQREKY